MIGSILLLRTGERAFQALVPFLILIASCLLAVQGLIRIWLARRSIKLEAKSKSETWAVILIGLAAIYGGYFGVAMSVVVLSLLGLMINDTLTRLNAIKQTVAFGANGAAAVLFIFSGKVVWPIALVMAVGALIGGTSGRSPGRSYQARHAEMDGRLDWIVPGHHLFHPLIFSHRRLLRTEQME